MQSLAYQFDDLPMFSERDASGLEWYTALVTGTAEIDFDFDHEWSIHSIQIDTYAAGNKTNRVYLRSDEPIYKIIDGYLLKQERDAIETRIAEAIDEIDREAGQRLLDAQRKLGTLNHQIQGI